MDIADPTALDAVELISVQLSSDRKSLRLKLRDQTGRTISLSLPANFLNTILDAMPREIETGSVHPLDSWSMGRLGNGEDLILTLRTPEGLAVSFATKLWQVEGMATIAHYGTSGHHPKDTIH
jgi:hypothetical protein